MIFKGPAEVYQSCACEDVAERRGCPLRNFECDKGCLIDTWCTYYLLPTTKECVI